VSVERTLLAGIGSVLTAVGSIAKIPGGPRVLLAKLGWDLPVGIDDIGLAALDMARVGTRLNDWTTLAADPEASTDRQALALAELASAVAELLTELGDLRLQAPQDYLDRTEIKNDFLTRLFDLYLIQAAAVASRPVFDIAALIGWFELRRCNADPAIFQVAHLRHIVHWDRLPMLLSDPARLLRETYGWGTTTFDPDALVSRLGGVLQHLATEVIRRELPVIPFGRLLGGTPLTHQRPIQLLLPLIGSGGSLTAEAGISVFGLPPSAPGVADGGIGVAPYASGTANLRIPLSSTLSIGMFATGDLGSGLALLLRPGNSPLLRTGLNEPQAGTGASGAEVKLDLTLVTPEGADGITLLTAGSTRIEATSIAVALGVQVSGESTDATMRLQIQGSRLTVKPELSFIEADGLVAQADVDLSWSHRHGVRLGGRAELSTSIAIGRRIGPVMVDALGVGLSTSDGSVALTTSVGATVALGPVLLVLEQIGVRTSVTPGPGNLGSAELTLRPTLPSGIGVVIDAPGVIGGGFLRFDAPRAEYSGILQLEIAETIAVKAAGLLSTRMPDGSKGYSLLILISAEGFAPIQLGFGFTLTGIGGLLGVNRSVMVEVLRAGLKTGTLGSLLFPDDPIRNAPQIISDLRAVFPPVKHRYVFGPMLKLAWGTPTLLTLELAVVLELPDPVRLVILGRLQALLPDAQRALVQVHMDAIGVIDFNRREVALDATLYDSRILQFALTGDMALRANWGTQPNFVLALGGLHPRFAAPAGLPSLARLALSLSDGESLRLRCAAYLALTSNTVQFGARLDLHAAGGGFSFDGTLGFDALFQLAPLSFIVDVGAALALRYHGHLLVGVSFDGSLAGPTPWHVQGKATIKVFLFKVSVHFDRQFGQSQPPPLPAPIDALGLLIEALRDQRNWSATLARDEPPVVSIRETSRTATSFRVHPLALLTVRQRVLPLNRAITKIGSAQLTSGPATFTLKATAIGAAPMPISATPVSEPFALAQYQELRDDEKLAQPAFATGEAGLQFGMDELAYAYEEVLDQSIAYKTLLIDPTRPPGPEAAMPPYVLPLPVLDAVVGLGAAGQAAFRGRRTARYRQAEAAQ
jgi:hypothetical protein